MTTPTALPKLTDEEMIAAWCKDDGFWLSYLRIVEAAVHAKLLPYFAQREREAERAAWNAAIINQRGVLTYATCKARESQYPPFPPQPSREIRVQNLRYRRLNGEWQYYANAKPGWCSAEKGATPVSVNAVTLDDFDDCAKLLREEQ